jgi:hypothetical protein
MINTFPLRIMHYVQMDYEISTPFFLLSSLVIVCLFPSSQEREADDDFLGLRLRL